MGWFSTYHKENDRYEVHFGKILSTSISFLTLIIIIIMWGCPTYHVWEQGLVGKAELQRAIQNRKIAVQEAEAKKEAASLLGEAEVARAKGVAEANRIIGDSLKGHEAYLRYLWIQNIDKVSGQIIYVPTEANLPILEAQRLEKYKKETP